MNEYYNVVEVDAAIGNLAAQYSQLCTLQTMPNLSAEGRSSRVLIISSSPTSNRDAILFTAGMHAREWGTCEILVTLAVDLLTAYVSNAGLQYGGRSVSAQAVQAVLASRDLVIFPLVNPDGRAYSQANDSLIPGGWRKNRRRLPSGIGVDIDRNFDVAWDYKKAFVPGSAAASDDPTSNSFHGQAPFSEAESSNVKWLLDTRTTIRWLVDIHSCSEAIFYNWGIDETQTTDPARNFLNPSWDHKRGAANDAYAEYKPSEDAQLAATLARRMSDAIFDVRGRRYRAVPSFALYPTSGTLDDYAYSRQWSIPGSRKIHAFVLEHGEAFHPPWSLMEPVVDEVCAGLLEFCVAVS